MKNFLKQYKIVIPTLLLGLFLGWVLFPGQGNEKNSGGHDHEEVAEGTLWTCSMHPQIQQDEFGLCPICAMDLIPLEGGGKVEGADPNEVAMTASAIKLAQVLTYEVQALKAVHTLRLQGKVVADERRIAEVTARYGGRIDQLFVSFTGQKVQAGSPLAMIYSPEILSAQGDLREARKLKESRPALYEAAKNKLLLWGLTEQQVAEIESSDQAMTSIEILAPITGVVTQRNVALGDYIKEGMPLFRVVDLQKLWIEFEAYESDLPWIQVGDQISYQLKALPGKEYTGKVTFIDPFIEAHTRVAKIRLEVSNQSGSLKPEMFVDGVLEKQIKDDKLLMVPKSSVLWTGKRSLVYVQVPGREEPTFIMRELLLGSETGSFYQVLEGLAPGEKVVANGVFKVDASAQLRGLKSMMNPDGGMSSGSHNHGELSVPAGEENMDHSGHEHEMTESEPSIMEADEVIRFDVDPLFQLSLNEVYQAYLPMKDAFVLTHAKKVKKAAKKLQPVLESVDMALLSGAAHTSWMEQLKLMQGALSKIINTKDIEKQRLAFSDFNTGLYGAVKSFGLSGQKVYYQFCPMAFNDQGGYWMSNEEIIANPYFGDVMLRCGEVKEIIEN